MDLVWSETISPPLNTSKNHMKKNHTISNNSFVIFTNSPIYIPSFFPLKKPYEKKKKKSFFTEPFHQFNVKPLFGPRELIMKIRGSGHQPILLIEIMILIKEFIRVNAAFDTLLKSF